MNDKKENFTEIILPPGYFELEHGFSTEGQIVKFIPAQISKNGNVIQLKISEPVISRTESPEIKLDYEMLAARFKASSDDESSDFGNSSISSIGSTNKGGRRLVAKK